MSQDLISPSRPTASGWQLGRVVAAAVGLAGLTEAALIRLGRTYGSTAREQATPLPGDGIIDRPVVVTNHAITIGASPDRVWPWLTQMGWHKGGWYTARWVDRLLFPANWPSATRLVPELQDIELGAFIPDGPPETKCGFIVEHLDPARTLVLHSTSHLPASWREKSRARLDWSWTFILTPVDGGRGTRFLFRSRWVTAPLWFTLFGWLVIVPADFIMARTMLNGVRDRAEGRWLGREPSSIRALNLSKGRDVGPSTGSGHDETGSGDEQQPQATASHF